MKKNLKKCIALAMSVALVATMVLSYCSIDDLQVEASVSTAYYGSGSIGIGSDASEVANLPTTDAQGTYRFTTDNYDNTHEALDTTDWATNWLWDLDGDRDTDSTDALSGTAYAFPLSYLMKEDGLRISKPSMTSSTTNVSAYNIKDNDTLGDFNIAPNWTCTNNDIDDSTDWSYTAVTTNPSDSSQSMTTTMTQGSPFSFIELENTNVFTIEKLRVTYPSAIVYEGTYNGAKMVVFRTNDITSQVNGYPSCTYQYYALFLPENSTITHLGTSDTTGNDGIGKLQITLPDNHTYFSFAWICESRSVDDNTAISYAQQYRPYAFNFITDTRADYSYDESTSTLSTTYSYTFSKKSESTADGTIMGILSHQYKYMDGYTYLSNKAVTLRGYMKFMKGSSYTTTMTYTGILPYMPELSEDDTEGQKQLQEYVDDFVSTYMSGSGDWTLSNDEGDETYYHAKKLNRSAQVVAAAKAVGDDESATTVLEGLEANLEDWFTYSGSSDEHYFTYYGNGVGSLLGFQTSFDSVDQLNDHHFHYGYFIESAASVGLWDPDWLDEYKDVIKQLIYDIASPYRDQDDCVTDCGNAYPYLRSFSPYEGHSWASGYSDERTGNNQESTSEAINAWAGIILFGELTGDDDIRNLGIYLYTTECAAAEDYWFDKDGDTYNIDDSNYTAPMASMVWGGKVDYATWFGMEYTQGIQICPMQSWSFYLLSDGDTISGEDYIKQYYQADQTYSAANGGSTSGWNDLWAEYYALADPETAMDSVWTGDVVNDGESTAHTYHYIQSLIDYGTPDLSFTCSSALASVFEKDGVYTYAVYNPESSAQTVTFTDSNDSTVSVKAAANTMTLVSSEDVDKANYTIEYYGEDLTGSGYTMIGSSTKYADTGTTVTATVKSFTGYSYDSSNSNNVISGTVAADGSLTLKVYYTRNIYSISYNLNGGTASDSSKYPSSYIYGESITLDSPTKNGYDFYGWYSDADLNTAISSITAATNGDLTLYAKWILEGTILVNEDVYLTFDENINGTFTIIGDTSYSAVNVLYKISDTKAEAQELAENKSEIGFVSWGMTANGSGWTYTENFSSNEGKYITFYFIRYDDNGGYKTDYGYGRIGADTSEEVTTVQTTTAASTTTAAVETTTAASSGSSTISTPDGFVAHLFNENTTVYLAWANVEEATGYKLYVDGTYFAYDIYSGINIPVSYFSAGDHTFAITAYDAASESAQTAAITLTIPAGEDTTVVETSTEEPTTVVEIITEEPTTEEPTTENTSDIVISDDVKVVGYQISATAGGSRVVGSVEPEINGQEVTGWGFIYAITQVDGTAFDVTDDDMVVDSGNNYVAAMASTSAGTSSVALGNSDTATYFVRTTLFAAGSAKEYTAEYKVRAYAVLADKSIVYSEIDDYNVYDIAVYLYENDMMNNITGHQYLYDSILTVVNPDYEENDYNWSNVVVKP